MEKGTQLVVHIASGRKEKIGGFIAPREVSKSVGRPGRRPTIRFKKVIMIVPTSGTRGLYGTIVRDVCLMIVLREEFILSDLCVRGLT